MVACRHCLGSVCVCAVCAATLHVCQVHAAAGAAANHCRILSSISPCHHLRSPGLCHLKGITCRLCTVAVHSGYAPTVCMGVRISVIPWVPYDFHWNGNRNVYSIGMVMGINLMGWD